MKNKYIVVITVLTLIITLIGATFSFFKVMTESENEAVSLESARLDISLDVRPLYYGHELLPLNNDDVMKAFEAKCIDSLNRGACDAYTIRIDNVGQNMSYLGSIKFTLNGLTNLNYMVLNDDNTIYKDITEVTADIPLSLGDEINLLNNDARVFKLIIWVPNLDRPQDDDDAEGTYNAQITYSSAAGSIVTGTFSKNN